uniref:Uncharacterized protein n=1 Tax=Lygus hesperus TaxID=30085 RepID=A0A146MDR3_LYGHE
MRSARSGGGRGEGSTEIASSTSWKCRSGQCRAPSRRVTTAASPVKSRLVTISRQLAVMLVTCGLGGQSCRDGSKGNVRLQGVDRARRVHGHGSRLASVH